MYTKLWEKEDKNFLMLFFDAYELEQIIKDNNLNLSVEPTFAMTQFLPMELFKREDIYSGFLVETLADSMTSNNAWVEKIYNFEEDFDDLLEQLRSSMNVKNIYFMINLEFTNNNTKNHFKLKHTRFLT
jgi:hypothetical protein